MGKTVTSEGERILTLLTDPRLWREGVAASDLASELNVTVRQLRRDRALLERHGFSTCVEVGDDGVHRVRFIRDGIAKRTAGLRSTLETIVGARERDRDRERD